MEDIGRILSLGRNMRKTVMDENVLIMAATIGEPVRAS